jgi:hypothetical protein
MRTNVVDNNPAPSKVPTTRPTRYNSAVTKRAKQMQSKLVTRDSDIRKVLLADLSERYNDKDHDLIVEEFGCNSARTDIAVINGALHAFEIKSDSDSLDRLPSQMQAYEGVFEYITLVCGRRLLKRARATIPRWWGLQKAEHRDGCVVLHQLRAPKLNPRQNALSLAKMLWKKEALTCLRKYGHRVVTSRHSADEVSKAVADNIPVSILTDEVRQAIKVRGGSGFAKQSTPDDDSCTIESTVLANRSSDLSWLLSAQFQSHPD